MRCSLMQVLTAPCAPDIVLVVRRTGYIKDEGIQDADLARVVQEFSVAPEVVHEHANAWSTAPGVCAAAWRLSAVLA